jgi:ubiquinone/menaquinone biosynthesis C-methylase UbiE
MELSEAVQLMKTADIDHSRPQSWTDLGCGSGTFTRALASLLPAKSIVYAIDKVKRINDKKMGEVEIIFQQADFEKQQLSLLNLDGILMANSLHYVADVSTLIGQLVRYLQAARGQFIIAEYDRVQANQWVPYPLPFSRLKELFAAHGFSRIEKVGEKKSLYQQGNLYVSQVMR